MKLIPPRNPKTEGDHLEIGRLEFLASSYEHNEHPRDAAVRHLRETIAAGRAGLDPYDETIFLLDATPNEVVWAGAVVNLTGLLLDVTGAPEKGGRRYRMILEADVRDELGLDAPGAPVVDDEPLASRRLTLADEADVVAGEQKLANPDTPVLHAIADARDAQQRASERTVH
jgi:hypothetical protein